MSKSVVESFLIKIEQKIFTIYIWRESKKNGLLIWYFLDKHDDFMLLLKIANMDRNPCRHLF